MKLTEYLHQLSFDPRKALDDRIVCLYDTKNNIYFSSVLTVDFVAGGGVTYVFAGTEPSSSFENINVIRAYTATNCINVLMGLEALTGNYGESEV